MNRTILASLALTVAVAASSLAACSSGTCGKLFCADPDAGSVPDTSQVGYEASFPQSDAATITVTCAQNSISVGIHQSSPTVTCTASSPASWNVDRAEIGVMNTLGPSTTAVFTPSGVVGGVVTVLVSPPGDANAVPSGAQILVKLSGTQTGGCPPSQLPTTVAQLTAGGGVGGVGGEGCGGGVTDAPTLDALAHPTGGGVTWLYPYDKTLWPRGILAPELQWSWATNDADAVEIQLATTSQSFVWTGTFSRPGILGTTGTPFIRHPIPQDIWQMATNTAGTVIGGQRDHLTVSVTIAKGGVGYGPITETWDVAPGALRGTVYYQSYFTNLVTNYCQTGFPCFGAGTLRMKPSSTNTPQLVAGNSSECRVCHSVAANGANLVTSQGAANGDQNSSYYDLKSLAETQLPTTNDARFGYPAIYPDGTMIFSNAAQLGGVYPKLPSALYSIPSGAAIATTGLPSGLGGATPAFSPDGKHVAFNFNQGTGADGQSLMTIDFNVGTKAFSNLRKIHTPPTSNKDFFPTFLPASDAVIFELLTVPAGDPTWLAETMSPARASLYWSDLATKTTAALDALNGKGYLPTGANNHADDEDLNFEPTVSRVTSGGYAWVIFTSRRMYGSIATVDPYCADPRTCSTMQTQPTPKKLWVSAIDLNAKPGTDPSHAGFYLPAQELLASNSRGYWVLDPCQADGTTCESGDECCGGYCGSTTDGGLTCGTNVTSCAHDGDKCGTDADAGAGACCAGLGCIGGYCGLPTPPR